MDDQDQSAPMHTPILAFRVVGFPGPFRAWGIEALHGLLIQAGHDLAVVDHLTDDHGAVQMLLGLDHQSAHRDIKLIAFLDAPGPALQALQAEDDDTISHTRAMTAILAGLAGLHLRTDALVIRPRDAANPAETARHLAQWLGIAGGEIAPAPVPVPVADLGALTRQIADLLLAPMLESVITGVRREFLLPRECLWCNTREAALPVVEISGPARPLYYGPFFHFLPGAWLVELELWFSDDVGDASFAAELFTGVLLSRARMRPGRGGWFRAAFPVQIDHPEIPIELRIWVERGAIEGRMGLRQIKFVPVT